MKTSIAVLSTLSLACANAWGKAPSLDELEAKLKQQQVQLAMLQQQIAELNAAKSEQAEVKSAQDTDITFSSSDYEEKESTSGVVFSSYGTLLYKSDEVYANVQDTDPHRRSTVDLQRVVTEFEFNLSPDWMLELELEYEHGGTGTSLEYDGFDEFGEFESEVEAGGEVVVEKLQVEHRINDHFELTFGHIFVPVGIGTELDEPQMYLSASRHWSEAALIPQVWHETGVNLTTHWNKWHLQTVVTTGLNSEYFRTPNWIAGGMQRRFESVNAGDLALTLRLDYGDIQRGSGLGVSFYTSDTSGNRQNEDNLDARGNVTLYGVHGAWRQGPWQVLGQYLYGELDDSALIAQANRTTPGLKPGNFARLGSKAESVFIEAGYNLQQYADLAHPLYLFASYDYANPMKAVQSGQPTERFDQSMANVGINYYPIDNLVLKLEGGKRMYAQDNLADNTVLSLSLGFHFSTLL